MNPNQENFLNLLKNPDTCILLAPAFAIDFKYPNILGMLKKLGADKITELTFGAKVVNENYIEYIQSHPNQKYYITSPCPIIGSMIKTQYKELVQYLVPIVPPLIAQAKIIKKKYPNTKVLFISPCRAKQSMEAKEYPELIDNVITFKELKEIFDSSNIKEDDFNDSTEKFDSLISSTTKIYPISGGLAQSSNIHKYINPDEILVDDGVLKIKKILDEIKNGTTKYRFFDLLNCDGGCIGGGEINNKNLPIENKKEKILSYKKDMENKDMNTEDHLLDHKKQIEGIDFGRQF